MARKCAPLCEEGKVRKHTRSLFPQLCGKYFVRWVEQQVEVPRLGELQRQGPRLPQLGREIECDVFHVNQRLAGEDVGVDVGGDVLDGRGELVTSRWFRRRYWCSGWCSRWNLWCLRDFFCSGRSRLNSRCFLHRRDAFVTKVHLQWIHGGSVGAVAGRASARHKPFRWLPGTNIPSTHFPLVPLKASPTSCMHVHWRRRTRSTTSCMEK